MRITSGLTHHIQRSTFTLSDASYMVDMLFVDEQTHTLLTLIGNDLLGRKGLVTDGQLGHVNASTALFHEL